MFGSLVIAYLFLGGAGAGACLVGAVVSLLCPKELVAARMPAGGARRSLRLTAPQAYKRLIGSLGIAGVLFLAVGAVCLLADVGGVVNAEPLVVSARITYISVGAVALAACLLLAVAQTMLWTGVPRLASLGAVRAVAWMLAAVACAVAVYTALLLSAMRAVPLWNSGWLAVLFVLSSLSCGIALARLALLASGSSEPFAVLFHRLAQADAAVLVAEVAALGLFLAAVGFWGQSGAGPWPQGSGTHAALAYSVEQLTRGPQAQLLWGGFVGCGIALPLGLSLARLVLGSARRRGRASSEGRFEPSCRTGRDALASASVALVESASVLVGGAALRFAIVHAAVHPVLALALG